MRDMSFFMDAEEIEIEEIEIEGINKFRFPCDGEGFKKGDKIPWVIKSITTERLEEITKSNTTVTTKKKVKTRNIDENRVTYDIMVDSIVYPNFKDESWLKKEQILDPVELLKKTLNRPGDFSRISKEVMAVNGLSESDDEESLTEEAKN
jgi:hypothetical protein